MNPRTPSSSPEGRRADAVAFFHAGLDAIAPEPLVYQQVTGLLGEALPGRIILLGGGKAGARMLEGAWQALADAWSQGWRGRIEGALSVPGSAAEVAEGAWGRVELLPGEHPLPGAGSVAAARRVLQLARGAGADDLIVILLSGGASALLALPEEGIPPDDLRETTRLLLHGGLPIEQVNAVRSHLSALAGGGLGLAAAPARAVCLSISDVPGDDLAALGGGPLSADPSTYADCLAILEREGIDLPGTARARLEAGARGLVPETPKPGDPVLGHVEHRLLANNLSACRAVAAAAESRGYRSLLLCDRLGGEARDLGRLMGDLARSAVAVQVPLGPPCALVSGGETTVRVRGGGTGGRNQESLVSAAPLLAGLPVTFFSAGSDGIDGSSEAAGGLVDGTTAERARRLGLDWRRALEDNDSATFLRRLGDQLVTGPTGTNVADLRALLVSRGEAHDPMRAL